MPRLTSRTAVCSPGPWPPFICDTASAPCRTTHGSAPFADPPVPIVTALTMSPLTRVIRMNAPRHVAAALGHQRRARACFWLRQSSSRSPPSLGSLPFSGGLQAKIARGIPAKPKRNPTDHPKFHLHLEMKGYGHVRGKACRLLTRTLAAIHMRYGLGTL